MTNMKTYMEQSSYREITDEEKAEGWVFAGFWPAEECGLGAPKGEYKHLGNDFYAYRGPFVDRL